ncbi:hypothetical protein F5B21DRAFT_488256 [Xylaria acuta]|nr:hypothetical protein F5B21DRAFT_488256 [Xylaria acuta]
MDCNSRLSPSHAHYREQVATRVPIYSPEAFHHDTLGIGAHFEEFVSEILQSEQHKYQIKPSCLNDGDLVVIPAVSHDGTPCEAQCFKKCKLPDKLYLSRKRRIQRLKNSNNLMAEVDQKGVRIIVSRVSARSAPIMDTEAKSQYTCCIEEFPPLCCSSKSKGNIPGGLKYSKLPSEQLSFAKATSSRLG